MLPCSTYLLFYIFSLHKFQEILIAVGMPLAKLKPSDIAAEAKRTYIPYIEQEFPQFPANSYLYSDSAEIRVVPPRESRPRPRVAVIDGDPVDVALDWHAVNQKDRSRSNDWNMSKNGGKQRGEGIPVVSMANEKRAGGDWESGLIAPEENLCRRSNLIRTLLNPGKVSNSSSNYPIPPTGGIYSPNVGSLTPKDYLNDGFCSNAVYSSLPF